jgi:hypothetical protein
LRCNPPFARAENVSGDETIKVIYVSGAARSGSTIVGVTLGNWPGVFFAGELDRWLRLRGVPNSDRSDVREFWTRVSSHLSRSCKEIPYGDSAWRALEHSSALVRPSAWRQARQLRPRYTGFSFSLLRSIQAISGCEAIVDTSHYPLRARELRRMPSVDVTLIWLVRDPRGVVASFRKPEASGTKSPMASNVYLFFTNLVAAIVFFTHPRRQRFFVSYEDFIKAPDDSLSAIVGAVESLPKSDPPNFGLLATGMPFQGNRLVRQEVTQLERYLAPSPSSLLTLLCQTPWIVLTHRLRFGQWRPLHRHANVSTPTARRSSLTSVAPRRPRSRYTPWQTRRSNR